MNLNRPKHIFVLLTIMYCTVSSEGKAKLQQCEIIPHVLGLCRPSDECDFFDPVIKCGFQRALSLIQGTVFCTRKASEPQVCCGKWFRKSEKACRKYSKDAGIKTVEIIGDINTIPGKYPHMALIGYKESNNKILWACGGALISEEFVLTSAQCEFIGERQKKVNTVRLGSVTSSSAHDENDFHVSLFIRHPHLTRIYYNDVALIKLHKKVQFSKTILPACLYVDEHLPQKVIITAGWGATTKLIAADLSDTLRASKLRLMEPQECNKTYGGSLIMPSGINENFMCSFDPMESKSQCRLDTGGPVHTRSKKICNLFHVVGMFTLGASPCGKASTPAVFTKVFGYLSWIEEQVWPDSDVKP